MTRATGRRPKVSDSAFPLDLEADALDAYERALALRRAIQDEWEGLGSPLLAKGSQGQEVEHPLIAMSRASDVLCDRLRTRLRKAHVGPEPAAVIKSFQTKRITRPKAVPATKATGTKTG
jgi:hypothetical protein